MASPVRGLTEESVLILPSNAPISLGRVSGEHIWLFAAQRFVVVPDLKNPGEYKTSTREYIYKLSGNSGELLESPNVIGFNSYANLVDLIVERAGRAVEVTAA